MVHPFHRLSEPEVIVEIAELERGGFVPSNRGFLFGFRNKIQLFVLREIGK
jgi:hypothetical protein